ncbi:MAG: arylsulfatase [Pseudomonadales bacterium]|nr:arylsulfatase [Pseudomonadales bacterium]MCP5192103.1 arylsulfatase [Pseudomonadales bacterium]
MNTRVWFAACLFGLAGITSNIALAQAGSPGTAAADLERKAPAGAPNVVLIMLDDVGFGAAAPFGGPAATPTFDVLADEGLRYNRFHTTAICSPTRASLLTGRNPHVTGIGAVMNSADDRPGYNGFQNRDTATIAEILREQGYSTAAFGKWHQTPPWETSQSGPFDRWPTGQGFEKFYGFQGGETDQFEPTLYDGTTPIMRPAGKHYHLTEDLADRAIAWMHSQKSVTPDKPFFLYFATGGIHAPIQVPAEWIEPYRGKFDGGWDVLREEIFERQKQLGIIPANTELTPRPDSMPAWDTLTPDQKTVAERLMESYAGFLAHTDAQVGRLVQALKDSGEFDNTLFIYILGDNGASAEGGLQGSINYAGTIQGVPEPIDYQLSRLDQIGGPQVYAHVNAAWAWATNAPFQWTKTVASHLGGTRTPMVITWPHHIEDAGGLRSQFGHVNDIVPTILEAAQIEMPTVVDGVRQAPLNGASLVYTFADANAPERHTTQYFEVFGNRAIYHDGWMASAFHGRLPWNVMSKPSASFDADRWELYDLRNDFSQAHDLAAKYPEKLAELKALFMEEAAANRVLPLINPPPSQRQRNLPDLGAGRTHVSYYAGTVGVPESAIPHTYNRSWSVEANVDTTDNPQGVIAALSGTAAGWSLYIDTRHRPVFTYRAFDVKTANLVGPPLTAGSQVLQVDFDYAGEGRGKGGKLTLSVNGGAVATDTVPVTPLAFYSIDETFDLGIDRGSPAGHYPNTAQPGYPIEGADIRSVTIGLR